LDVDCCGGICLNGICCPAGSICVDAQGTSFCCGGLLTCDPASGVCRPIEALDVDRPVRLPAASRRSG
jgi:hypothetical protein